MRRGVLLLTLGVLAAVLAAASAHADGTTTTATTTTGTTATTTAPTYARLAPSYLPTSCVGAGGAAIAEPGRSTLTLDTPASDRGPSAYPGNASVFAFDSSAGSGSTCAGARVTLQSVSLLGGVVTATSVEATGGRGTVSGLQIQGSPTTLARGEMIAIGNWAQLTYGKRVGRVAAPLVLVLLAPHASLPAGTVIAVAFAAAKQSVAKPKHGSSSGTAGSGGQNGQAAGPQQSSSGHQGKKHRKKHKHVPQPLTVTPPLGFRPSHYVFPVDGGASYGDTYGGVRNDIYDGWHHGDDLFASLGTPIVAVANGKLSLVGWNRLGGWRLWLTDGDGNSFYYAHLAGYSRWILDHPNVRAGQVVGFLGRTGDAFTTAPHLHFEIHPHQFLKLGYDGAVDPTAYLEKWAIVHVPPNEIPQPAKLKAPVGTPTEEASVVWHQLLVARHLLHVTHAGGSAEAVRSLFPRPRIVEPAGAPALQIAAVAATTEHVSGLQRSSAWVIAAILAGALLVLATGGLVLHRRRRRPAEEPAA